MSILIVFSQNGIFDSFSFWIYQCIFITNEYFRWFDNRQAIFELPLSKTKPRTSCRIICRIDCFNYTRKYITRRPPHIFIDSNIYCLCSWSSTFTCNIIYRTSPPLSRVPFKEVVQRLQCFIWTLFIQGQFLQFSRVVITSESNLNLISSIKNRSSSTVCLRGLVIHFHSVINSWRNSICHIRLNCINSIITISKSDKTCIRYRNFFIAFRVLHIVSTRENSCIFAPEVS